MTTNPQPYLTPSDWSKLILDRLQDQMREGIRRGRLQALNAGRWPGRAPLGYLNRRLRGKAVIEADPAIAPFVQEAFSVVASGKHSPKEALQILTERGLRSQAGKPLGRSAFYNLLTNPFYIGQMKDKGKVWPAVHEPLVDKKTFETVQEKLAKR